MMVRKEVLALMGLVLAAPGLEASTSQQVASQPDMERDQERGEPIISLTDDGAFAVFDRKAKATLLNLKRTDQCLGEIFKSLGLDLHSQGPGRMENSEQTPGLGLRDGSYFKIHDNDLSESESLSLIMCFSASLSSNNR